MKQMRLQNDRNNNQLLLQNEEIKEKVDDLTQVNEEVSDKVDNLI